ncbi:DEAD/DEAH box helicase [Sphingomonas montanisoli]|uniref:Transcription-repair-coupling factor n=2 Tax=Sphingomonas montanisoli TaxID=2606412 RepID=A0A5D9C667_9SPHN|nr:DEAD/DEAH box helicase [Sphingomonas montanisoli]
MARLAAVLGKADVICVTLDESRAEAIAAALGDACPGAIVVHLPAPDGLPGETVAASPANIGARHAALAALTARGRRRHALILSVDAAMATGPAVDGLGAPLTLAAGQTIDADDLCATLERLGYQADDRIDEPGEMARRGMIELFPTTARHPVRLDIADGRLTAIRGFDPVTQRTTGDLETIVIDPATWDVGQPGGTSALAVLPKARLALDPGVAARGQQLRALARETGARGLIDEDAWLSLLDRPRPVDILPKDESSAPRFVEQRRPDRAALSAISAWLADGDRVILAGRPRDLRFLKGRLGRAKAPPLVEAEDWAGALSGPSDALILLSLALEAGWEAPSLHVIAAADILGSRAGGNGPALHAADPLGGAVDYRIGDVIIHEDHGLGVLLGLEAVQVGDTTQDAIRIGHAKDTQRLVPIEEADRLWRYGADAEAVSLDRLDGTSWVKRRGDIDAQVALTAKALLGFAADRAARRTDPIDPPSAPYETFIGRFPFAATRDQLRAVEAVRADLASGTPMDRLIVGDVGYGKTEVALRAAAMVALAGHQVALVAPTTVLARQHLESFTRRFAGLGLQVAGLSRLSSAAEAKAVKSGLADGSIAIVIGTQALAADSVAFADLGLVIIDEEQRFGAADKAKLRARAEAGHVLTLTATPIPRTLQGALVGLQDLSVIATPPARRQPIRTATGPFDPDQVRAALLRERARGGQSFVVVPRIDDMAGLADQLARLVPDLIVHQAHGKMAAAKVDQAMVAFAAGQGDILLATNIIEAGLDVPRANTMIVMHADRFGLAQLHQLRGRVGRGARRGTILLLTEPGQEIAPATAKRLKTLEALDHLGAGFAISAQDLDQRGAGDLVGEDQAGHVRLIGVDLYQHLLARALAVARGEAADRWTPELHLGEDARFPADWIAEEEIRLNLYLRLGRLADEAAVDQFAEELEDRFGALPAPAQRLLAIARIRRLACAAHIARIDAGPAAIALTPRPDFEGNTSDLEAKGDRLLLRGDPGPDPLAAVAALLERVTA